MKRILAIDGGGIRGIIPAMLLAHMEKVTGGPIGAHFDLISGTSTGGIIACAAAVGIPMANIVDLYVDKGPAIFANPRGVVGRLAGPKYWAKPLEAELEAILGDRHLAELAGPELLVPCYCIAMPPADEDSGALVATRGPGFFRSDLARMTPKEDFLLRDVARATSAAPTYFPPAAIKDMAGRDYTCIDGGVWANDPARIAYDLAVELWPDMGDGDCSVLSLGTGSVEDAIDAKATERWGEIEWIETLISAMMDGAADEVDLAMSNLLGKHYWRIDIGLAGTGVAEAFDDASGPNISRLQTLAGRMEDRIGAFMDAHPALSQFETFAR